MLVVLQHTTIPFLKGPHSFFKMQRLCYIGLYVEMVQMFAEEYIILVYLDRNVTLV